MNSEFDEGINIKLNKIRYISNVVRHITQNAEAKSTRSTQLEVYKAMNTSVLTYSYENWAIERSERYNIEAAEFRFLRSFAGHRF
jgi:hypothetical protein